jgi:hypothetical protein
VPFADAAQDVLQRFAGVRVSASTVRRCTEAAGERLRAQQQEGRMVQPAQAEPQRVAPREAGQPTAYVGRDAFSVPLQGPGARQADQRMLYMALLYTPPKEHARSLVDFDLAALADQIRAQARAVGVQQVGELLALTAGGHGSEEALQRHLAAKLTTILDWYHAAAPRCAFAKVWHPRDEAARPQWQQEAQGIRYERGGEALLTHLQGIDLPPRTTGEVREELRKLIGSVAHHRPRTDYPTYRRKGWDIGSGPTEAACKSIGARLKGSGMRGVEDGAATVAALRALYVSGGKLWDGFGAQPHCLAA